MLAEYLPEDSVRRLESKFGKSLGATLAPLQGASVETAPSQGASSSPPPMPTVAPIPAVAPNQQQKDDSAYAPPPSTTQSEPGSEPATQDKAAALSAIPVVSAPSLSSIPIASSPPVPVNPAPLPVSSAGPPIGNPQQYAPPGIQPDLSGLSGVAGVGNMASMGRSGVAYESSSFSEDPVSWIRELNVSRIAFWIGVVAIVVGIGRWGYIRAEAKEEIDSFKSQFR